MNICSTILDAIGDTPMVRINRITRGVIDQGPHGRQDDRRCRAGGAAEARGHDHRGHVRQYGHGPRHRGGRARLQVHLHDDRQTIKRKGRRLEGVRRGSDRLPDQRRARRSAVVLLGVVTSREGDAECVESEPVRQPVQLAGPLRTDRPRDLGSDRRHGHAPGRRRRHGRDDFRHGAVPEREESEYQNLGHRHVRIGLQEVQGDRRPRQARDLSVYHRGHR